jgi:hypothetical protein
MSTKNERRLLIESTKLGFKQFLLEVDGGENALEKAKANPDYPIYLVGIIQKGDAPNRNGRIYPFDVLKKDCDRYMAEEIKENQSYGELDHPANSTVPELKNAAMTVEDIWYKGTEVWGKVKLLNAYMPESASGRLARGIVLNGKTLGISSRALGSVYADKNGYDVVEDDLEIICWDLVSRPSTYNANLRITEAKMAEKGMMLTESKCFGGKCNLGKTTKELVKEAKLIGLSTEDKVFLECMGVEDFLKAKYGKI